MKDIIKIIATFLLAVSMFVGSVVAIDTSNPCSNFSKHPEECSQAIEE